MKQSGNRSRTDSGNVASSGAEGSVSSNPDALSPPSAAASDVSAVDAPPTRLRERRSNKSTNYDSVLKTPFPRRGSRPHNSCSRFLYPSRILFQLASISPYPPSRP